MLIVDCNVVNLDWMINMALLTADQAAEALGISKPTLYAYVSRGLLQSVEGEDRSRRYRWEDIERLRLRKQRPREAAEQALYWGLPSVHSTVSQIADGKLLYRGRDAVELAFTESLEECAGWLWTGQTGYRPGPMARARVWNTPFLPTALSWLAEQIEADPAGWDLSPDGLRRSGWRIFSVFYKQVAGCHPLLHAALVLCADHELNASTFATRVAASTGASLYAAVSAGLATLSGPRHGGACGAVEALFREAHGTGAKNALVRRLRRGDPIAGFGHRLYPQGDPRARALLEKLGGQQEWISAGQEVLSAYPSIDLALVALGLEEGKAFQIFATGRCLGWVAHAMEQSQDGRMIRPRAGL
jgi:citrate synthase